MEWATIVTAFLAAVFGGGVTLVAQRQQFRAEARSEVRSRSNEAAESIRTNLRELLRHAQEETDVVDVSALLESRMREAFLPAFETEAGYLADRAVREEVQLLIACLDRWHAVSRLGGDPPRPARWRIAKGMDELLGGYRRGDKHAPPAPEWLHRYQQALEQDDINHEDQAREEAENSRS